MRLNTGYDVIVVGGGMGGVCAAVGAAKEKARVLLIERYGFLGGMATAGLVNPFMPYRTKDGRLTSAVFNEILFRLQKMSALDVSGQVFDDEIMKFILDQMIADYGIDVLFHTQLIDARMDQKLISSIITYGKSGALDLEAKIFIDSTGDGDLAALAGAQVEIGRPKDGLCQPMTLCFRVGGVMGNLSPPALGKELTEIFHLAKDKKEIKNPREDILVFGTLVPHIYHFNTTRIIHRDATSTFDLSQAEIEGRKQVFDLFSLFKSSSPRFKDAYLIKIAPQIGVRESRRVLGKYKLTMSEVIEGCKYPDGIARSNYPIDIHNPDGEGTSIHHLQPGDYYEVPYRCLVPKDIKNLIVGSRCISATHEAHSSLRVMPVVAGIGEAAGLAVAWAVKQGILPSRIDGKKLKASIFHPNDEK